MKKSVLGLLTVGFTAAAVLTATSAVASPADQAVASGKPVHKAHKHHKTHKTHKTPSYTPPPIAWAPQCASASLQAAGAQCGLLTVPLDYAKPNGTKIKIAVSRIAHKTSDAAAQGIMLVNPGGPGGSGLTLSRLGAFVPKGGGDPYDWIGFDPRGVGSSQPSLACDGNYFPYARPDYVPFTKTLEKFWAKKAEGYAKKCHQVGGKLLDHLKTTDTVNDIESIRKALGQQQINYYGFSYGTTIGQVYATQHPDRVRRMIFDGVVNPAEDPYTSNLGQDVAFEKTEDLFFAWVAKYDGVYGLGDTQQKVKKLWLQMLDKTRQAPLDGKIGPDEWTDAFLSAGYYVYGWEDTANAFKAAVAGDYAPIIEAYDGANGAGPGSDNGFAIYLGTQCTDAPWPQSAKKIKRDNWATYAKAPFETWANAQFNGPCLPWKGKAAKKPFKVDGRNVPPVLLIAETYDAATPFGGAIEARKRFPKSVLIEGVNGTTHAGSLSGVSCTDDRIADYLLTGALDARVPGNQSDVKCDPVPAPDPTAAAAAQRKATATTGLALPADLREVITSAAR
ncbi:MAG: peptidase [Nocardioidaceae bacterium]|nr:peptidase [Nocardioidaceae bacterium]